MLTEIRSSWYGHIIHDENGIDPHDKKHIKEESKGNKPRGKTEYGMARVTRPMKRDIRNYGNGFAMTKEVERWYVMAKNVHNCHLHVKGRKRLVLSNG